MKKLGRILHAASAAFLLFAACRGERAGVFRLAVIMDAGGIGDKGKNDMVWRGCQQFMEDSPAPTTQIDNREPQSWDEGREFLKEVCREGADAVVVASPAWEADVIALARRYPRTKFVVIGGAAGRKNVKALSFPARDSGYLMGVAAAAAVPCGGYGFIGGREDAVTRALAAGYAAGVHEQNPGAAVDAAYLGKDFCSPLDTKRAEAAAAAMYAKGVAVIFAAAGPANMDIARAARDRNKLVIGYESNQNALERGYVVTSLNIRWDVVVAEELDAAAQGRFEGGVRKIDIASDLIEYPVDINNRALMPAEAIGKIEATRQRLAAGR